MCNQSYLILQLIGEPGNCTIDTMYRGGLKYHRAFQEKKPKIKDKGERDVIAAEAKEKRKWLQVARILLPTTANPQLGQCISNTTPFLPTWQSNAKRGSRVICIWMSTLT